VREGGSVSICLSMCMCLNMPGLLSVLGGEWVGKM
jgi:hypothetical protein